MKKKPTKARITQLRMRWRRTGSWETQRDFPSYHECQVSKRPVMLRIEHLRTRKGVLTSTGAWRPVHYVRRLLNELYAVDAGWTWIEHYQPMHRHKDISFAEQVWKERNHVTVGCTDIPMAEVKRIAKQLGIKPKPQRKKHHERTKQTKRT